MSEGDPLQKDKQVHIFAAEHKWASHEAVFLGSNPVGVGTPVVAVSFLEGLYESRESRSEMVHDVRQLVIDEDCSRDQKIIPESRTVDYSDSVSTIAARRGKRLFGIPIWDLGIVGMSYETRLEGAIVV